MSKVYYIASDFELPEVDYTGAIKKTLKEMKKINPLLQFPNWMSQDEIAKLDENMEVLYIENESDLGALCVCQCSDLPYDVEPHIKKEFIYHLSGNMDDRCIIQLVKYLEENLCDREIELWSVWLGDELPDLITKRNIDLRNNNKEYDNLKLFLELDYCKILVRG